MLYRILALEIISKSCHTGLAGSTPHKDILLSPWARAPKAGARGTPWELSASAHRSPGSQGARSSERTRAERSWRRKNRSHSWAWVRELGWPGQCHRKAARRKVGTRPPDEVSWPGWGPEEATWTLEDSWRRPGLWWLAGAHPAPPSPSAWHTPAWRLPPRVSAAVRAPSCSGCISVPLPGPGHIPPLPFLPSCWAGSPPCAQLLRPAGPCPWNGSSAVPKPLDCPAPPVSQPLAVHRVKAKQWG